MATYNSYYQVQVVGGEIRLVPVGSNLYPTIKFGTNTSGIDAIRLVAEINRQMTLSSTYRDAMALNASEGVVLKGIERNHQARFNQDPASVTAVALYPGYNIGNGTFVNNPNVSFEIEWIVSVSGLSVAGEFDYEVAASTLPHEAGLHPTYGRHNWKNYPSTPAAIIADPVYSRHLKMNS